MKHRLTRIAVVVLMILLAGFLLLVYGPQPRDAITQANFAQIKKGMTQDKVASLLGVPTERNPLRQGEKYHVWQGVRGTIKITFNADGQVADGHFMPSESLLNRVRDWFGQ